MGETEISVPRDRDSEFESILIPKHKQDVSNINRKVIAMYSRGMSTCDISSTIDDIYGFKLKITDYVLEEQQNWQNRPLKPFYSFIFVDCLFVNYESRDCAVYTILAYDMEHRKDILGLWILETESKHFWMQIFDKIKSRGVQEVEFICMDGLSGELRRFFLILSFNFSLSTLSAFLCNMFYKDFCSHLKKIYTAPSLKLHLSLSLNFGVNIRGCLEEEFC